MKLFSALTMVTIICFSGCQNSKHNDKFIETQNIEEITAFNDSIFFGWIRDIEISDNQIYFADNGNNKVLISDYNLDFIKSFGERGPGPNEFQGLRNIDINDNKVYAYDYSKSRMIVFNSENQVIKTFKVKAGFGEFTVLNSEIILNSYDYDQAPNMIISNFNLNEEDRLGTIPSKSLGLPAIHVLSNKDYIINVYRENSLQVDIYDHDGNLLNSSNLKANTYLGDWISSLNIDNLLRSSTPQMSRSQILCMDAYLTDHFLYIMPPQIILNEKSQPSIVIRLNIDNAELGKIDILKIREPDQGNFYTFAVSEDDQWLFGYDPAGGSIVKIKISE